MIFRIIWGHLMKKNRLHRKFIQILIIPDDKSEPRNFSVPVNKLKWLKATAVILACHFLFGFFAYGQWYRIANSNRDLRQQNTQLKQTNKRIYELTSEFEKLESSQLKIRAALGLGNAERVNEAIVDNFVEPDFEDVVSPVTSPAPDSGLPERYREIKRLASELHEFDNKFPTLLPVEGFLTADYMDVSYSELDTHYGIDIAATRGKLVKAAADGLAIFSGWTHDLGYLPVSYTHLRAHET